jgi:hypothetical protein
MPTFRFLMSNVVFPYQQIFKNQFVRKYYIIFKLTHIYLLQMQQLEKL